jgi:hypothetical protein
MANANSQFGGYLTNVGVAKQTNANALGIPWKITTMLLGDAGGEPALFPDPTPQPTQTALIRTVYEAPINSLYPSPEDPGILIAELVLPPNVGGWWIRESALKDEDGHLIAVAAPAPSYKPLLAQGSGRTQTIRMHVVVGNTANITLKIDPSIVLATRAEMERGDTAAREYAASLGIAHLAATDPHPQYRLRGAITSLNTNTALTAAHEGLVLIDATAGDRTITLPASIAALGVRDIIVRRTDNSGNRLVIQASGNNKIKFHTHLRAEGYPFLVLMGAGDYWHLRSDAAGNFWPIARRDEHPLGNYADGSSSIIPPGGYGIATGAVSAVHYPWLHDFAQQSGALVAVGSRTPKDGRWSISADGQTIHLPSPGSAFFRAHDLAEARGLGEYQGDAIRNITGSVDGPIMGVAPSPATGAFTVSRDGSTAASTGSGWARTTLTFNASHTVPTAAENRPENVTVYPLIKLI